MGWLGSLFGTDKAVDNVLDKDNGLLVRLGSGLGNLVYTDQEKAENAIAVREATLKQLDALAPFKIMQRIMVTIIMTIWGIAALIMMTAICFRAGDILDDMLLLVQTQFMWMPVSGAVGLYLLGGVWKGGKK
jgi:hypothetical protein